VLADVEAALRGGKDAGHVVIEASNLGMPDRDGFDKRAARKLKAVEKSGKKGKVLSGLIVLREHPVQSTEAVDLATQQWLQMVYAYSMRKLRPENIMRSNNASRSGQSANAKGQGLTSHTVQVGVPKYLIVVHVRRGDIVHDGMREDRHEHLRYFSTVLKQLLGDGSEGGRREARMKAKVRAKLEESATIGDPKKRAAKSRDEGDENTKEDKEEEAEEAVGFPLLSCAVAEVVVISQGAPAEFAPLLARYPPPCIRLMVSAGGIEKTERASDVFAALDVMAQVCVCAWVGGCRSMIHPHMLCHSGPHTLGSGVLPACSHTVAYSRRRGGYLIQNHFPLLHSVQCML
jgi:hypothetical protein